MAWRRELNRSQEGRVHLPVGLWMLHLEGHFGQVVFQMVLPPPILKRIFFQCPVSFHGVCVGTGVGAIHPPPLNTHEPSMTLPLSLFSFPKLRFFNIDDFARSINYIFATNNKYVRLYKKEDQSSTVFMRFPGCKQRQWQSSGQKSKLKFRI